MTPTSPIGRSPGPAARESRTSGLLSFPNPVNEKAARVVAGPVVGADLAARALIGVLIVFATLESVVGFCAGCWLFGRLMDWGLVPESTCEVCRVPQVSR